MNVCVALEVCCSARERTVKPHLATGRVCVAELPVAVQAGKIGGN